MQSKISDLKVFLHTLLDESKLVVLYAKLCSVGFLHYYVNINIIVCYPWIKHRDTFWSLSVISAVEKRRSWPDHETQLTLSCSQI